MSIKLNLLDDQFPFGGKKHTRIVVRAIVINDEKKIALCHVVRNDAFGKCDYYETPGGGKEDNEDNISGVIRELDEEIGYHCKVIEELGLVDDYYNLIGRNNKNYYYLCKIDQKTTIHHESTGDELIKEIVWVDFDEGISLYGKMKDTGLELLVKRRELPIILEAKKIMLNCKTF